MTDYIGAWGRSVLTRAQIDAIDGVVERLGHPPKSVAWDHRTNLATVVFDELTLTVQPDGKEPA